MLPDPLTLARSCWQLVTLGPCPYHGHLLLTPCHLPRTQLLHLIRWCRIPFRHDSYMTDQLQSWLESRQLKAQAELNQANFTVYYNSCREARGKVSPNPPQQTQRHPVLSGQLR